ncbi:tautomerase family protein [Galbibacter pacificus]|uniref:Tautomerase family protein n=1 Tax=Galbibacter pacificus TaxID=2996052 RepID=A0ABT6FVZ8_9FLAO|nr:tautomerase family protein [Galbibacter pacificus]MDG3584118.1 tautomerase family protein [Galbibacter pacificus]MDG3587449.1 tautomerase family protein [Galbibacter pacificus]
MPLVKIDIIEGRNEEELTQLTDVIQEVMMETFAAPKRDRFQIINEHKPGQLKILDAGLGYTRSDRIVFIQITQQGRTRAQKQAMYARMSEKLKVIGIPPTDLIISVVENKKEDWSFGEGKAQFLTGDL